MKRILLILAALVLPAIIHAQTLEVKEFQGTSIAQKMTNAQNACIAGVRCVLHFRPELSVFALGTLPALGANQFITDPANVTGLGTVGPTPSASSSIIIGTGAGGAFALVRDLGVDDPTNGAFRVRGADWIGARNSQNNLNLVLGRDANNNLVYGPSTSKKNVSTVQYDTVSASTNASIGATTMATAGASGNTYRFTAYLEQTALGVACTGNTTVDLRLVYTPPSTSSQQTLPAGADTGTITTNGSLGGIVNGTGGTLRLIYTIRAKASTTVEYSTLYILGAGCTTGPSYQVYPILEVLN